MSKITEDLIENKKISNDKLLDYIIGIQLTKIERYNNDATHILDSNSEDAMANMIELLKMRQKNKKH